MNTYKVLRVGYKKLSKINSGGYMTEEELERVRWINAATYFQLLEKWRFAPPGDPFFEGDVGKHFESVMCRRKAELGPARAAEISKNIGWGRS